MKALEATQTSVAAILESGNTNALDAESFWTPLTLERIVERQGVLPADNLDSISELWPVDDDPDELLRFVLSERATRRQAINENVADGCQHIRSKRDR